MNLMIKICGMRDTDNILRISSLQPDMIGFIFYPPSSRFVQSPESVTRILLPKDIIKVGVFVNSTAEEIMQKVNLYDLQAVQLHGNESVDLCKQLKVSELTVIKAFQISALHDFHSTSLYETYVDYFLFDSKTDRYGGSGQAFNWNVLQHYQGNTPFFLSGGIGPEHVAAIQSIRHERLVGVDLNSKFETAPGIKDYDSLQQFIHQVKNKI